MYNVTQSIKETKYAVVCSFNIIETAQVCSVNYNYNSETDRNGTYVTFDAVFCMFFEIH